MCSPQTEKPLMVAAIVCPLGDMMYGTHKCEQQKEAYQTHYRQLQESYLRRVAEKAQEAAALGLKQSSSSSSSRKPPS
eukprot:jgi/Chrzof1/10579/Cz05g04060.t1